MILFIYYSNYDIHRAHILLITTRWCSLPEMLSQYLTAIILIALDLSLEKIFSTFKCPVGLASLVCYIADKHTNDSHTCFCVVQCYSFHKETLIRSE